MYSRIYNHLLWFLAKKPFQAYQLSRHFLTFSYENFQKLSDSSFDTLWGLKWLVTISTTYFSLPCELQMLVNINKVHNLLLIN